MPFPGDKAAPDLSTLPTWYQRIDKLCREYPERAIYDDDFDENISELFESDYGDVDESEDEMDDKASVRSRDGSEYEFY